MPPFICSYGRSPDRSAGLVSKFHDTTVVSHVVSCCSWVRGWWGAAQLGCTPHLARRHATPETTTQFTRCRPGGTRQVLVAQRKRRISMAVLLTSPEVRLLNAFCHFGFSCTICIPRLPKQIDIYTLKKKKHVNRTVSVLLK